MLKLLTPAILILLIPASATAQDFRPRVSLMAGLGVEAPSCEAGCRSSTALTASLDVGASYQGLYWGAVKALAYTEPDLIEQASYTGSFIGLVGGYQLHDQLAVYGGVGRNAEQWSSDNVTSNGAAVVIGGEALLARTTGFGLRLQAELMHSMTGSRVVRFENTRSRGDFRPRLMHVSLGVIWR